LFLTHHAADLAGGAVLGLRVGHAEGVVDQNAAALVDRQVMAAGCTAVCFGPVKNVIRRHRIG